MNSKPATERLGHHSFSLYLLRMSGVQAANTNVHTLNASYILISFVELNNFLSEMIFFRATKSLQETKESELCQYSVVKIIPAEERQHF
jgi:hypothetical protein